MFNNNKKKLSNIGLLDNISNLNETNKNINLEECSYNEKFELVINSKKNLEILVKDSQTPRGLNEQGLKNMNKKGVYKSLIKTLNSIHKRLNK